MISRQSIFNFDPYTYFFCQLVGGPAQHSHLFSWCASAFTNSVSVFNFLFLPLLASVSTKANISLWAYKKINFLKLHTWICCCCWLLLLIYIWNAFHGWKVETFDRSTFVWYHFWAVVCSRKTFDWSFFLLLMYLRVWCGCQTSASNYLKLISQQTLNVTDSRVIFAVSYYY